MAGRTLEATEGKTGSLRQTAEEVMTTFCSFCLLAQYYKILSVILLLKLLSRGCSEGICSGHLTCSWITNQKSDSLYGYICGCLLCHLFSIKSSVLFNKIVAYEEWLNCMVLLRTSDLKNDEPGQ